METHRCKESLHNKASIRYTNKPYLINKSEKFFWWLFSLTFDHDYDYMGMTPKFKIKYCPFCGQKLQN